jgi:hypothetical protein
MLVIYVNYAQYYASKNNILLFRPFLMYRGKTKIDAKNPHSMEIAPPYVCTGGVFF